MLHMLHVCCSHTHSLPHILLFALVRTTVISMGCVISCFSCASSFFYRAKKRELGPILYDRQSETLIREKLPISTWLENGIMYSRPLDIIDRTKFIRKQLKS